MEKIYVPQTPPKDRCPNENYIPCVCVKVGRCPCTCAFGKVLQGSWCPCDVQKNPVIIGGAKEVARHHVFSDAKWEAKLEPQNLQNHRAVRVVMLNHFNNFMNVDSVKLKEYLGIPQKSRLPISFLGPWLLIWENSPNYYLEDHPI